VAGGGVVDAGGTTGFDSGGGTAAGGGADGVPEDITGAGWSRPAPAASPEAGERNIRTPIAASPAAKITIPVNKAKNNPSRRVNFARLRFFFFTIRPFLGSSSGFLTVLFTPLRIAFIRNLGQWRLFQKNEVLKQPQWYSRPENGPYIASV
jgi:hypothetical protein